MYTVLQSTFLKALGWSILDSFWQMGTLWIVYLLITGNGKKLSANQRHNLAFLSLAAGALWFIASIYMNFGGEGKTFAFSAQSLGYVKLFTSAIEKSLPLISAIYLVVILSLIIRLYRQYRHTHRLATTQLSKADPEIRVFLAHLAAQMGIKKEIRVFLSGLVHTPLTIGFWKPVILLPVALVNNLTIKQTESLILHELYHIQRNDFVMNLLLVFADILLFFNPFAKFFKSAIQQEREHRCDDIVVQFRYDPADYAKALLIVEQQRANTAAIFMAATGAKRLLLLARVKRLLTGETLAAPVSQKLPAVLIAVFIIVFVSLYSPAKDILSPDTAEVAPVIPPVRANSTEPQLEFSSPYMATQDPRKEQTPARPIVPKKDDPESEDDGSILAIEQSVAGILVSETIADLLTELAGESGPLFVSHEKALDFSVKFDASKPIAPVEGTEIHPFVPSNSFEFFKSQDEVDRPKAPKPPAPPQPEAPERILNWELIEKDVQSATSNVDLEKLRIEVDKALADIDWLQLHNTDPKKSLEIVENNLRKYKLEIARVTRDQRERTINSTRKLQQRMDSTLPAKRAVTVRKTIVTI